MKIIDNLGIASKFDAIIDGTMCSRGKPAPDLFFMAASTLEIEPKECVIFEDSQAGIQAAGIAGMKSIGIGTNLENTDIVIRNFTEPDNIWHQLQKLLTSESTRG